MTPYVAPAGYDELVVGKDRFAWLSHRATRPWPTEHHASDRGGDSAHGAGQSELGLYQDSAIRRCNAFLPSFKLRQKQRAGARVIKK